MSIPEVVLERLNALSEKFGGVGRSLDEREFKREFTLVSSEWRRDYDSSWKEIVVQDENTGLYFMTTISHDSWEGSDDSDSSWWLAKEVQVKAYVAA